MMSRLSVPCASWLITSLSAKTVQVELIPMRFVDSAESFSRSSMLNLKNPRHDIQEASRSRRALVIHLEVDHGAVFDL